MIVNSYHPYPQKTAGIIRYSCGILFMLFSFSYLYYLQGEILAEAQFVYSKGVTTYNLLLGAIIITLVLQLLQWVVRFLSRLPSRWHAFSYLPSMLLLAILTDVNPEAMLHFSLGAWLWIAPALLIAYILLVIIVRKVDADESDYPLATKSQAYPNLIILFLLMLLTGAVPQTPDVYHYELKAERLLLAHDYEGAAAVGEKSLRTTARLNQLRMYALSQQGLLPERIFHYPHHDGSRGLLDITDTFSLYRLTPQDICSHLGARPGKSVRTVDRFYQLLLADTLHNQHVVDYYLCSLLLDKELSTFQHQLPRYYNLSDTLVGAYDRLPTAYREALLLIGQHKAALDGHIVIQHDTLATLADIELVNRFRDYCALRDTLTDKTERVNRTHREFGDTYWWYYEFSHLATGELKKRK